TALRYGGKDYRGLKKCFAAIVVISLVVTVILTVLSLLLIRPMLQLMQTPPEILDQAQTFISIILLGIFASVSFNLLSNV
ncbi:MATE family efflux transporter, partial [Enterococcus faecium]|uniref:MATE family efflux transporter n=1 Tax=Enterococcus faecium TaxID=1352 RepID=UPI003CC5ED36